MYTRTAFRKAQLIRGAAVACALLAGNVLAKDHGVTVAVQVSTRGLNPGQPAGARALYSRIKHAAQIVCTHGNRVDLKPAEDPVGCYEKALGNAILSAKWPLVTQLYLETHTPQQAAAYGIGAPVQLAAK
jgi:UrcA family protein